MQASESGQIPFFSASSSASARLRNSPYIGWFRHAPPAGIRFHKVDQNNLTPSDIFKQLAMVLDSMPKMEARPEFTNIINGRLRGGGKEQCLATRSADNTHAIKSFRHVLQETSEVSSSATVKVLARLGSWFLFPLAYDAESCGYRDYGCNQDFRLYQRNTEREDYSDCDSASEGSTFSESEEDDSTTRSECDASEPITPNESAAEKPLGLSVSEISEAYHAHQEIDQSEYSTFEGHRLDYVITQMDIARMARNASRHLDVDSILSLPTVTYRSPTALKSQICSPVRDSEDYEAWSFVMVPENKSAGYGDDSSVSESKEDSTQVCVICLEQFVEGDRLRVLPCNHSFHAGCIDRWLSGSHSHLECFTSGCPTCKKRPTIEKRQSNDGSVPSWAFAQLGDAMARSSALIE